MANTLCHFLPILPFTLSTQHNLRFPTLHSSKSSSSSSSSSAAAAAAAYHMDDERPRFKEFPYVSAPMKDLMLDLVSTVENRLESQLLPCTLPQDVQYYENQSGTAHGSLFLRSGHSSSPIDFIFGSWLHFELPTGAAINITSLLSYMNDSTDIPQLLIEFIQSSPTSLVILLDLPHRRDLVLNPDYLKTFYEDTNLDNQRELMYKVSEIQPYVSPSLYIRSVFSPTAAVIRVDTTTAGGVDRMEEILTGTVSAVAKEVLGIWLDFCALSDRKCVDEVDRVGLKNRDRMFKQMSIEIDLGASLPRMFGQEIADRVVGVLLDT